MLKFYSFLTGIHIKNLNNIFSSTRSQIVLYGNCLIIPVLLWFFIGFLSLQHLFGAGLIVATIVGLILAFLILLVERSIILTEKGKLISVFRVLLGFCIALIGAVMLDVVIFQNDIENKLAEFREARGEEVAINTKATFQFKLDNLNEQYDQLNRAFKRKNQLATEELTKGKVSRAGSGPGPVHKLLQKRAENLKMQRDAVNNKRLELNEDLNSLVSQQSELAMAEFNDKGLLMQVRALHELINTNSLIKVVFWVIFVFLFALEFIVIIVKLSSSSNLGKDLDAEIENQIRLEYLHAINRMSNQMGSSGINLNPADSFQKGSNEGVLISQMRA